jgi:hypothetical protein
VDKIFNQKLIPIDETYYMGLGDFLIGRIRHPLNDFYYKADDFSMNIYCSLKWALWAYKFLTNISKDLIEYKRGYEKENGVYDPATCSINSPISYPKCVEHQLILDNTLIQDENHFVDLMNDAYNEPYYDQNSKTHFKLKVNLQDFLMLQFEVVPIMFEQGNEWE